MWKEKNMYHVKYVTRQDSGVCEDALVWCDEGSHHLLLATSDLPFRVIIHCRGSSKGCIYVV
jgi:hypothetical protein